MTPRIRILEPDANKRGDLFGRLMADVLLALGYDRNPRLNVHKAGREVDIAAAHRTERRLAVAECKATRRPIGGDDLNKFAGVLQMERRRAGDVPVQGYFISLGGFREAAIEQERDAGAPRFVILDGADAARELIDGRIVVTPEQAIAAASALVDAAAGLELDPQPELLAHDRGWIWCVYLAGAGERSHFALVHAGGQVLGASLSDEAQGERGEEGVIPTSRGQAATVFRPWA